MTRKTLYNIKNRQDSARAHREEEVKNAKDSEYKKLQLKSKCKTRKDSASAQAKSLKWNREQQQQHQQEEGEKKDIEKIKMFKSDSSVWTSCENCKFLLHFYIDDDEGMSIHHIKMLLFWIKFQVVFFSLLFCNFCVLSRLLPIVFYSLCSVVELKMYLLVRFFFCIFLFYFFYLARLRFNFAIKLYFSQTVTGCLYWKNYTDDRSEQEEIRKEKKKRTRTE